MFYDLNVRWPLDSFDNPNESNGNKAAKGKQSQSKGKGKEKEIQSESSSTVDCFQGLTLRQKDEIHAITQENINLGYSVIAFNHEIHSKFIPNQHQNPFYSNATQSSLAPFPQFDPRSPSSSSSTSSSSRLLQLSRLTLNLDQSSLKNNSHNLLLSSSSNSLLSYDLLSVKPFDETSFSLVCLTLTDLKPTSIDIISLDLSGNNRLPFFLKRSTVSKALENGAVFEVCYGETLGYDSNSNGNGSGGGDKEEKNRKRRNLISCTRDLLRQTNGKGVILSSGVRNLLGLRGPNDVINLAYIFGMTPNAAKDSISANCRSLIIRAQTRKTYRGLISDPKLVTRISEPVFPKEKADGIVDTSSSKEKEKITSSESPAISVAASNLDDVAKSQAKEIVPKGIEIPDPGLDMLGLGNETSVGKKVPIDVGVVNGKESGKSSKGKKRKLDDEDQEEDVERTHSIKQDGTKSNKKGKNAIGNGKDSSPISNTNPNPNQVGKKSSPSPNKIHSSRIKDSLADLLARGPMGNVGNGNENGEGKKKKKRRKISGSQLPN